LANDDAGVLLGNVAFSFPDGHHARQILPSSHVFAR
jgi:hypothetical protein